MSPDRQIVLPQMPTPLRSVTPAKVQTFDDCPRRFRYTYVDRPPPPRGAPWAHTGIGAAVHTALKNLWDLPPARRSAAQAVLMLRSLWPSYGFRDDKQSADALDVVSGWLESYVGRMPLEIEPRGVERTVAAPVGTLAISGRVDRIDEVDGPDGPELVIIDYKTGRFEPDQSDVRGSMQLAMYAVAARRTFRARCTRVELHHLPTGTVAAFEHNDESLRRHLRRASDTADDIQRAKQRLDEGTHEDVAYPARPGMQCGYCDFRSSCSEGMAAGPARESWFAVPVSAPDAGAGAASNDL